MAKKKCLYPGCPEPPTRRGNCTSHYRKHWKRVTAGKISWQELERRGLVKKPKPGPPTDYDEVIQKTKTRSKAAARG